MRKKLTIIGASIALSLLCGFACGEEEMPEEPAVDVPFTVLDVPVEQWTNLGELSQGLLIINSDAELDTHWSGEERPEINFTEKSLLVAYWGDVKKGNHLFFSEARDFRQVTERDYVLTIYSPLSAIAAYGGWLVVVVVNKLSKDDAVEIEVITENNVNNS